MYTLFTIFLYEICCLSNNILYLICSPKIQVTGQLRLPSSLVQHQGQLRSRTLCDYTSVQHILVLIVRGWAVAKRLSSCYILLGEWLSDIYLNSLPLVVLCGSKDKHRNSLLYTCCHGGFTGIININTTLTPNIKTLWIYRSSIDIHLYLPKSTHSIGLYILWNNIWN